MKPRRERLEAIGKAVLTGDPSALTTRIKGQVPIDPTKQLVVEDQRIIGNDFSSRRLGLFCAIATRFQQCSFRDIRIEDAVWGGGKKRSEYVECCFDGAKFRSVAPGNARFVNCSFRDIRIYELYGFDVEFINCVFTGRIDAGYLNGTRDQTRKRLRLSERLFGRKTNEIFGNDFSECELVDFAFRTGVDLEKQKLPIGQQYLYLPNAALAIEKARNAVALWPKDEIRRLATIVLNIMADDLNAGQKQQFLRLPIRGEFAVPWEHLRHVLAESVPNP